MPLRALYMMVLEHDIKIGNAASETVGLLQQKEFYQVPHLWMTMGGFSSLGFGVTEPRGFILIWVNGKREGNRKKGKGSIFQWLGSNLVPPAVWCIWPYPRKWI